MCELTAGEYSKNVKVKPPKKFWKDPENHVLEIAVAGDFEAITIFCDQCKKAFKLTRKEVEKL